MSALAQLQCFHCGLPVPPASTWAVTIDATLQPMCCPGCEAVAQGIVEAGLADYYRTRTSFAASGALALLDAPPAPPPADQADSGPDAVFTLEGIRCAACVWLIERRVARLPGVLEASVNVATERLHVRWGEGAARHASLIGALGAIGYQAYPHDPTRQAASQERARKKLFRQLFVAGLCMMQVMMYALPAYVAEQGTLDADMAAMMRWASLLLTVPALLYSAQPFFIGAWASLRAGMPGMDVPVALGIAAAGAASTVATLRGVGEVYFDSVTMFIFLLLASRYLEQHARRRAGQALERLHNSVPDAAWRLPHWPQSQQRELVAGSALARGDLLAVAPGESLAADAVIVDGVAELDLSLLTGESRPVTRAPGDEVPGGAVNAGQAIVLRVLRPAAESTIRRLVQLADSAGIGKPRLALWADKVASWFVCSLLVLTLAVFAAWQWIEPARAWPVAIAVLVVSCPCALSLATPGALAAATARLVRRGVLIVRPHVLETLHRATVVVFDKTGTLTAGRPVLTRVDTFGALDQARCLQIAAALEAASAHPLAAALRAASSLPPVRAAGLSSVTGHGVSGSVDGVAYRLGNTTYTGSRSKARPGVYLAAGATILARFEMSDAIRPEAAALVRQLHAQGRKVVLLSGDDPEVARQVGRELGIETVLGGQLPQAKLDYVRGLQQQGEVVAMVGDGINDAAVLGAADVSFAMGSGAALAQLHADCLLLAGSLAAFGHALDTSARCMRVIRQNLAWATLYNLLAIPAAALGMVAPWVSAVGMSLSSALVVINALRLRR